ncbi:MAG: hypothetical protein AB1512_04215 [Thermodesulfobacteriota bacterium]
MTEVVADCDRLCVLSVIGGEVSCRRIVYVQPEGIDGGYLLSALGAGLL